MPEDLKLLQIGSFQLPPPFRGLHSPGVRKHFQIIFASYFRKSPIVYYLREWVNFDLPSLLCKASIRDYTNRQAQSFQSALQITVNGVVKVDVRQLTKSSLLSLLSK